jgi:hypothetical protein
MKAISFEKASRNHIGKGAISQSVEELGTFKWHNLTRHSEMKTLSFERARIYPRRKMPQNEFGL